MAGRRDDARCLYSLLVTTKTAHFSYNARAIITAEVESMMAVELPSEEMVLRKYATDLSEVSERTAQDLGIGHGSSLHHMLTREVVRPGGQAGAVERRGWFGEGGEGGAERYASQPDAGFRAGRAVWRLGARGLARRRSSWRRPRTSTGLRRCAVLRR